MNAIRSFSIPTASALLLMFSLPGFQGCRMQPTGKLLLIIVVDQLSESYYQKVISRFPNGGFSHLQKHGTRFTNHWKPYANTETSPGHATLITGALPRHSGIVKNRWYPDGTEARVYSVDGGPDDTIIPGPGKNTVSPVNMLRPALGDHLKEKHPGAKVFAVSGKDRSAVLLGGRRPTGVYWPDPESYNMSTSGYYASQLPGWVENWNQNNPVPRDFKETWTPEDSSLFHLAEMPADNPFLRDSRWGGGFPHTVDFEMFGSSPFLIRHTLSFIKELVKRENLGQDSICDVMAWSISMTDYMGHRYGVESREVLDTYLRVDAMLLELFTFLDGRFGEGQYAVALTSDHGVRSTVELLNLQGDRSARRLDKSAVTKGFVDKLREEHPIPAGTNLNADYRLVRIRGNDVYFNRKLMDSLGLPREDIKEAFKTYIKDVPGIIQVYDPDSKFDGQHRLSAVHPYHQQSPVSESPKTPEKQAFIQAVEAGKFSGRSGQLYLNIESHSNYDGILGKHGYYGEDCQRIPLWIRLPGQRTAKTVERRVELTDLAPTLAHFLGLNVGGSMDGKLLPEVFEGLPETTAQ